MAEQIGPHVKFLREMEKLLLDQGDPEANHSKADVILCQFLRKLGYNTLVDTYEKVEKWYA